MSIAIFVLSTQLKNVKYADLELYMYTKFALLSNWDHTHYNMHFELSFDI